MFRVLLILGLLYLLILLGGYVFQRQLTYFPDRHAPDPVWFHASDMHEVILRTQDGVRLLSWYKPPADRMPIILYLHGNAGHVGYRVPSIRAFLEAGFGVFLLEYRGYGGNGGKPDEQGLYEDARTAMRYLQAHSSPIALYGESLGTGVASQMALEFPVCALILQSPFTSLSALARYHYPWFFLPLRERYETLSKLEAIHVPVLVIHGDADAVVPYSEGLTVYNKAHLPKELLSISGGGHPISLSQPDISDRVLRFVQRYCH